MEEVLVMRRSRVRGKIQNMGQEIEEGKEPVKEQE